MLKFPIISTSQERGAHPRPLRLRWLAFVAVLITLMSLSFVLSPTYAAGETSNLNNRYINVSGDVFPGRLYRGARYSPDDIFVNGFNSRGTNYDLIRHVDDTADSTDSGYISTSISRQEAVLFAEARGEKNLSIIAQKQACSTATEAFYASIPVIGQFLLGTCINRRITANTYVYEIDPAYARNAYYVPTEIRANAELYAAYAREQEWAYIRHIPREAIVGVHVYHGTTNLAPNGTIDPNTITFTDANQFVANPYYGGTTHTNPNYQPANDTGSGWNPNTDPDLPTTSCPANPSVYMHCG